MSRESPRHGQNRRQIPSSVLVLVLLSVFYNAILAALNAVGVHQTYGTVALTEAALLVTTAAYIAAARLSIDDPLPIKLAIIGVGTAIFVSFASQAAAFDCGRFAAIIGMFLIIGSVSTERQVLLTFRLISIIVLAVLILELVDTTLYVKIFQPAAYYSATRGIEEFSLDDSGLFRNALGFQSRFSFGLSSHRTASVFVEQVSLANYSGILCIFLLACYGRLDRWDRILHISSVLFILLTNDSRTSSIFALVSLAGAFVFPRCPPRAALVIMPLVLTCGCILSIIFGFSSDDDLRGRVSTTIFNLMSLDFGSYFGFGARQLPRFLDSGYPYIIASSTVVGLVFLWLFLGSAIVADTPARRRCLFGLNIYMCSNLLIGGTAVFSIKIAAPLWLLMGYMGNRRRSGSRVGVRHSADTLAISA